MTSFEKKLAVASALGAGGLTALGMVLMAKGKEREVAAITIVAALTTSVLAAARIVGEDVTMPALEQEAT